MPWSNKSGLAKLTAILAVTLGISFGLCAITVTVGNGLDPDAKIVPYIGTILSSITMLSLFSLIITGVVRIFKKS